MPVAILDLVVIGVVLVSAVLAMLRGFTREVLAIGSWATAAIVAYLFYKAGTPLVQEYLKLKDVYAEIASAAAIFLGTLIVAYFVTAKISDMILDSRIGALDRTLGFMFGAVRGLMIAIVLFMFFHYFAQGNMPAWAKDARSLNLLQAGRAWVMGFMPDDPDKFLRNIRPGKEGDAPKDTDQPQKKTELPLQPNQAGYSDQQRQQMRGLIETTGSTGQKPQTR